MTLKRQLRIGRLNKFTLMAMVLVLLAILATTFTPKIGSAIRLVQNFPATACPGNLSDGAATVALSNSKVKVRSIPSKSNTLTKAGLANYLVTKHYIFIKRAFQT